MFNFLANIPSSLYAFLSGIFISISTTAAGNLVLSESPPTNQNTLISVGVITLMASVFWLLLSERIVSANLAVERSAASLQGDPWSKKQQARAAVKEDYATGIYLIAAAGVICSVLWIVPIY